MKKFLVMILSVLLFLVMTSCNEQPENTNSNISSTLQDTHTSSAVSGENESDHANKNSALGSSQSNDINNNINQSTQSNPSQSNPSQNNSSQDNSLQSNSSQSNSSQNKVEESSKGSATNDNTTTENIDNGVLEKATAQKMSVPENMKLLGTDKAKEENNSKKIKATVALYQLDGDVVNWITENDFIYVITSGNNRLVVINSKTMMAVSNTPLAGKPAEINIVGQEIYISLPDLYRIDIFSKADFVKKSSLYFDHEVSSFCVDDNYIYYSEHDQHCDVYKKNMTTNELTKIVPDRGGSFFQPKLYLNKQDNILYIGETGTTGSAIYYYDATTLQLKSLFRKDNYGIMNHTRDIFHVENEIFWGNYCLSDTNAKQIVCRYGVGNYGSVNFASKEVVSTFEGLFLTDTCECIINYFDAGFEFEYMLVSKSYNVFFRARSIDKNIIVGVNFSIQ